MTANKRAGCTAAELATLGETFNLLATKAYCLAELLLRTDVQQDDTEAAEALARQMGAIADTAAEWAGIPPVCGGVRHGGLAAWLLPADLMRLVAPVQAQTDEGSAA